MTWLRPHPAGAATPVASPPAAVVRPDLDELIALSHPASGIALARPTARALQSGQYLSRFKGRGMEFDEARLYMPGDDVRNLDWRVTARTGRAHTKLFREERERPVFLSVDYRASMFFATRGMYKSAMAARLAALVAWSARRHDDRIGGQVFSEAGSIELRPEHGQAAVLRLLKVLVDRAQAGAAATDGDPVRALEDALLHLPRHARPGSLVFIFSDFRGLNAAGEAALSRLSRHCDGVLVMIHDPLERHLPPGRRRYGDGTREWVIDADRAAIAEWERRFLTRQAQVRTLARRHGLRFVDCGTAESPLAVLQRGAHRTLRHA
ncbi:DUF58 domain-containing protein [Methyloparacoccus murrellii]